jgi:hypothetical protein
MESFLFWGTMIMGSMSPSEAAKENNLKLLRFVRSNSFKLMLNEHTFIEGTEKLH